MLGSTLCQVVLRIVFFTILARLLTPEDYGVFGAALIVMGFSTILADLGVGQAIIYQPELNNRQIAAAHFVSVGLGTTICLLLIAAAPWIGTFFDSGEVVSVVRWMALAFVARGLSVVAEALLQRDMKFRVIAVREVAANLAAQGLVGICLAALGLGYWALVYAYLATELFRACVIISVQPHARFQQFRWYDLRGLIRFGFGISLSAIFNRIALQIDNLFVGRFIGLEALGIYGRAYQLVAMPATTFGKVSTMVLFPALNEIREDEKKLRIVHGQLVSAIALVTIPSSILMWICAPTMIRLLLGEQWIGVIAPFQILVLGVFFRLASRISGVLMRSTGKVFLLAWSKAAYAILITLGAVSGIKFGITGVAWGILAALASNYFLVSLVGINITKLGLREFLSSHYGGVAHGALIASLAIAVSIVCDTLDWCNATSAILFVTLLLGTHVAGFAMMQLRWYGVGGLAISERLASVLKTRRAIISS